MIPVETVRIAAGSSESEFRVKGSRFIAVARPVEDMAQAAGCRAAERRRFHDATHHVYAALLRNGDQRFDDDGEPAGTAGRPTLAAIERAGLRLMCHGPCGLPAVWAARSLPTPRLRSSAKRVFPLFHSFHWKQRSRLRIHESKP